MNPASRGRYLIDVVEVIHGRLSGRDVADVQRERGATRNSGADWRIDLQIAVGWRVVRFEIQENIPALELSRQTNDLTFASQLQLQSITFKTHLHRTPTERS